MSEREDVEALAEAIDTGLPTWLASTGCPDGMYPWDVDYAGEVIATFEEFRDQAYHDCLNLPISWYFQPPGECDEYGFELVFVMPRKYGKTWSLRLAPGFDRAEVEAWLDEWTREVAAEHYGWTARPSAGADPTPDASATE